MSKNKKREKLIKDKLSKDMGRMIEKDLEERNPNREIYKGKVFDIFSNSEFITLTIRTATKELGVGIGFSRKHWKKAKEDLKKIAELEIK